MALEGPESAFTTADCPDFSTMMTVPFLSDPASLMMISLFSCAVTATVISATSPEAIATVRHLCKVISLTIVSLLS